MSRNARFQFLLPALLGGLLAAAGADFSAPPAAASARVVIAQGDRLLDAFLPNDALVETVFNRGLTAFAHAPDATAAWHSLVTTNDTVGIKVFSAPGPLCGTRPAVVAALVRGLLAAGLPGDHIIIWDRREEDLRTAGFFQLGSKLGVRVAGAVESGYDEKVFYRPDSPVTGALAWGDLEFGRKGEGVGKKSFVSKLVSREMTKIISVAPLINENAAGLGGHLFSLALGSVDNTRRFEGDADRLAVALPEIFALPEIGDRVALCVTDALLGQYQGGPASFLQYTVELNQLWFSRDPVALDTLAIKELARARAAAGVPAVPLRGQIFTNAALLQLGINDPARIQVEKVK